MKNRKVVMISTGGTIASKRNEKTGLLTSGLVTGQELSTRCNLPSFIELEVDSVFQIPSNKMDFDLLMVLKSKIEKTFEREDVTGIVVTHGTDTLEETAYFLDLVIEDNRPVVVTGSQRGPDEMGTDSFVNLKQSFLLAINENAYGLGVLTLFNERIFCPKYLQKVHSSNVAGFNAHGYGYIGTVDQDKVKILQKPLTQEKYKLIEKLPNIEIIKTSIGSSDIFIQAAIEGNIQGIIIEAAGRGHVPPNIMEAIRTAVEKGIVVIVTTSAEEGDVKVIYDFPGSAYDLSKSGAILGSDYDSKKARIKLAVLLAARERNIESYFH